MISARLFQADLQAPWLRSYLLAQVSELVYSDDEARNEGFRRFGFSEELFVHGRGPGGVLADTEVALLGNPELLIVAFRGSETGFPPVSNLTDWLNDATMIKTRYLGTRVHRGFVRALLAVWPVVENFIRSRRRGRALWLTGHSLGGALAQLAAYSLTKEGVAVSGVVTFGSPRVGGGLWKDAVAALNLNTTIELWINNLDPVARLPPSTEGVYDRLDRFPLWAHVGQIHFIHGEEEKIKLFYNQYESFNKITLRFGDHTLNNYIRQLERLMPNEFSAVVNWHRLSSPTPSFRTFTSLAFQVGAGPISLRNWMKIIDDSSRSFNYGLRAMLFD